MKKPKLKLQQFEILDKKDLPAKLLSKILGGKTDFSITPSGSNAPNYSISVITNSEVETSKEN